MITQARRVISYSDRLQRKSPLRYLYSTEKSNGKAENASHSAVRWYVSMLDSHPVVTKGITSGIIAGSGDFLCQLSFVGGDWDRVRTGRFFFLGTLLIGPVIHFWYAGLAARLPGSSLRSVSQRVFLDQAIFAPVFLPVWLSSLWTLEGNTERLTDRLWSEVPSIVVANWSVWVPAQAINFCFVPVKFQVLFSNIVGLAWNTYLSYLTSRTSSSEDGSGTVSNTDR